MRLITKPLADCAVGLWPCYAGGAGFPSRLKNPPSPYSTCTRRLARWQVERIFAHVDRHLDVRLRADELAGIANLSSSHFFRCFKRSVGVTPSQYVTQRRIDLARQLMLATELPLTQIALSCGFCDQAHFTRIFRRWVGETPFVWRRANACAPAVDRSAGLASIRRERRIRAEECRGLAGKGFVKLEQRAVS